MRTTPGADEGSGGEAACAPTRLAALVALALAGATAACAASQSSTFGRAGNVADVTAALARSGNVPGAVVNGTGKAMAFLVITGPRGASRIAAVELGSGAVVWRQDDEPTTRITVARSAVVYARKGRVAGGGEGGALVGRDVRTGALLWEKPLGAGWRRMGVAADGDAVYQVIHPVGDARRAEVARYHARTGSQKWRREIEGEAGAPAARGGLVVVPRRTQFVSLLDADDGRVLADILSREETASFVRALPEGLFFGSRGVFLASPANAMASRHSGGYLRASVPELLRPAYHWDMYRPEQGDYSAVDRNRLLWRVTTGRPERGAFAGGRVVVHSFRFFFGLDAATGALAWAYSHPRTDAVASEWVGSTVLFASAAGELGALDVATGRRIWQARPPVAEPGFTVRGATFDAEGWTPAGGGSGQAEPLARTLASILWDPDRRFVDVKLYAISELTRLEGAEVTSELLRALEATELPPAVIEKAEQALAARRDPASHELYARALRTRSDYAEDRRPPRLDVLARAVAVTRAASVVPALIEHLRLPETDPSAVRAIADAALATGAREAVPAFEDFLLLYRADPAFARAPEPVLAAAEVLLRLGGPSEKTLLLYVAEEPRTVDPLRVYLRRTLFSGEASSTAGGAGQR